MSVWDRVGIDLGTWRSMPWSKKRRILHQYGHYKNNLAYYLPTFYGLWLTFKLWKNRPPEGYMVKSWIEFKAEEKRLEEERLRARVNKWGKGDLV